MPMGLSNSPAIMQRMANSIVAEIEGKFVMVYMDDVMVFSENWEDHLNHLE